MRTTVSFSFVGEPAAKSVKRKAHSYEEAIPLAEIGDRIFIHPVDQISTNPIAGEELWSGKVVNRTFVYSKDGVSITFELEKGRTSS